MSEVTRSMEAESAGAAARVDRRRRSLPAGLWGTLLFIATEATLFGTIIGTYFYLRFNNAHWPPPGVEPPEVALPLALTGALVLTTIPMFLAAARARAGDARGAIASLLPAFVVQTGYLVVQIHLGAHHVHVLLGLFLDLWAIGRLLGGMTNYRLITVRVVAFYWYFVNALAVAVVLTQLSPSL